MAEEHLLKMMLSTMPARAGKTVIEAIAAKAITPGNRGIHLMGYWLHGKVGQMTGDCP